MHYVFFYSAYSQDWKYVKNTVLLTVDNETEPDIMKIIEIVYLSDLDRDGSIASLQDKWEVSTIPSFVAVKI